MKRLIILLSFVLISVAGCVNQAKEQEIAVVIEEPEKETETVVPILMYHYVRDVNRAADPLGWNLSISPTEFEKQLAYLKDEGFVSVHLSDLIDGAVPERAIILSFDDGLSDFYTTALPLLQEYGFTATNSIIAEWRGGNHMTKEQIKDSLDAGVEITSHTLNHPNLTSLESEELRRQLVESKAILEEEIGVPVDGFVYPAGKVNGVVRAAVEEAGYKVAVTTAVGVADLKEDDLLMLPRLRVDNRVSMEGFRKILRKF